MVKINAWVNLRYNILANRLLMRDSSVLPLLIFYSLISFISVLSSINSSYSSFPCSLARFLTQPSVSLGELSEPRVFSLVSPLYSTLFRNNGGVSLGIHFSTSVKVIYVSLFLGLTGHWIYSFLIIEVSEVFLPLFLQGLCCWSVVTVDKLSSCPDKTETLKLSLWIFISEGFLFWYFYLINYFLE